MKSNRVATTTLCALVACAACEQSPERAGGGPSVPYPTATPTRGTGFGTNPGTSGSPGAGGVARKSSNPPSSSDPAAPTPTQTAAAGHGTGTSIPGDTPDNAGSSGSAGDTSSAGNAGNAASVHVPSNGTGAGVSAGNGSADMKPLPCKQMWVFDTGGNGAIVQAAPAPNAAGIDMLLDGATVQALGIANERYVSVSLPGGKTGYVAGMFLTCDGDTLKAGAGSPAASPTPANGVGTGASAIVTDPGCPPPGGTQGVTGQPDTQGTTK